MNWRSFFLIFASVMLSTQAVLAATLIVNPAGSGAFRIIQEAINAAQPGDEVIITGGTYAESLTTQRHGTAQARITIRAAAGAIVVVTHPGQVLDVQHAFMTVDGLILDGQFGAKDLLHVGSAANHFILRGSEVRRSARDCVDMDAPENVLIESTQIHHCLFWDGQRQDAHGITGDGVQGLTIRDTEIFYVSGDAIQFAPSRAFWDNITVENCHFWNGPLPQAAAGFAAGMVTGENAFDTKTPTSGPRSRLLIRNCLMHGFRGVISNQAAMNIKENVDVTVDRVTIYDSDIAFRMRGPARATVTNCVLYDVSRGVRYEDGIDPLRFYNCTFGGNIARAFQNVGGNPEVRNSLFLAGSKPSEANHTSNLAVPATHFVDPTRHDYHLTQGASAIDTGLLLDAVRTDRDGVTRPQGAASDIGAYERFSSLTDTTPPAPPMRVWIIE
jgi:hypothetical protein